MIYNYHKLFVMLLTLTLIFTQVYIPISNAAASVFSNEDIRHSTDLNEHILNFLKYIIKSPSVNTNLSHVVRVPYNRTVSYELLMDDSFIFMDFANNVKPVYYRHYFKNIKTIKIGSIPKYLISTGNNVLYDNTLLFLVSELNEDTKINNGFKNVFYSIDIEKNKLNKMSSDTEYLPAAYIYPYNNNILVLNAKREKDHELTTIMSIYDITKKQFVSHSQEYILNEYVRTGANIVNCTASGDFIYAIIKENSDTNSNEFSAEIQVFDDNFKKIRSINLGEAGYLMETRISKIVIFSDFIFLRNYSGDGILGFIEEDTINIMKAANDIDIADNYNSDKPPIFFKRFSNIFYSIDTEEVKVNETELVIV